MTPAEFVAELIGFALGNARRRPATPDFDQRCGFLWMGGLLVLLGVVTATIVQFHRSRG
jgi:hypothetical protein